MSSNIFSTGKVDSGDAILEKGQENVRRVGRSRVSRERASLFPGMDTKRALVKNLEVYVTSDNRMSDVEAGRMTSSILSRCGLSTEDDSVMVAFVKAMCLCMAINSSSVLVPGRSKMYVGGSEFDFFADVMVVLGNDARRYFRAYADVTRGYLKDLIRDYQNGPITDGDSDVARYENVSDMYEAVRLVAMKRGLLRAMDMIHDSAEFCSNQTSIEMLYLSRSKETIFASGAYSTNLVDHPVVGSHKASRVPGAVVSSGGDGMPEGY